MKTVDQLIEQGSLFVISHSGGKDSQAMYLALRSRVPRSQLVLIHADLGDVEWPGAQDHIRATTDGEPLHVCRSRRSLLQMIEERGKFPSPSNRQCTSDLKRGPIERTIRGLVKQRKLRRETGWNLVVSCMGMRAEESPGRAKLQTFKLNVGNSKAGREWYDWLPIHDMSTTAVFDSIRAAGQHPHPIYAAGMSRFSCCFCIMSSRADLTTAARLNPELYRRYVDLERSTGHVMIMPTKKHGRQGLEQITGVAASAVPMSPSACAA